MTNWNAIPADPGRLRPVFRYERTSSRIPRLYREPGYRPFVEACTDADEKGEALKYIPKLADPREKAEAYARIGMAKEAADAASQAKDGELLARLKLTFAQNAAASSIFDTLRDRLSFPGA